MISGVQDILIVMSSLCFVVQKSSWADVGVVPHISIKSRNRLHIKTVNKKLNLLTHLKKSCCFYDLKHEHVVFSVWFRQQLSLYSSDSSVTASTHTASRWAHLFEQLKVSGVTHRMQHALTCWTRPFVVIAPQFQFSSCRLSVWRHLDRTTFMTETDDEGEAGEGQQQPVDLWSVTIQQDTAGKTLIFWISTFMFDKKQSVCVVVLVPRPPRVPQPGPPSCAAIWTSALPKNHNNI